MKAKYYFVVICSLILLYFTIPIVIEEFNFLLNSERSMGKITRVISVNYPLVFRRFSQPTRVDFEISFEGNTAYSYLLRYGRVNESDFIGKTYTVVYSPYNSSKVAIVDFTTFWIHRIVFSAFILFIEILALIFSLITVFMKKKNSS